MGPPDQFLRMRTASARHSAALASAAEAGNPLRFEEARSIPTIWRWIQHGYIPEIWNEDTSALQVKPLFDDTFGGSSFGNSGGASGGGLLGQAGEAAAQPDSN